MRTRGKLITNWKHLNGEVERKTVEEIILDDSGDEESSEDEVQFISESGVKSDSEVKNNLKETNKNSLEICSLRGLLPYSNDESYFSFLKNPVVKRCCIEHCYFMRSRPRPLRYNLRRPLGDTVPFENKNSNEQQTIDLKNSQSEKNNSASLNNSLIKKYVKCKREKNSLSSSSTDSITDDSKDKDYQTDISESESESVVGEKLCDSVKKVYKKVSSNKNVNDTKKVSNNRLGVVGYPSLKSPNDFVSVHDVLNTIKNMQKLVKTKNEKKSSGENSTKSEKTMRVKKIKVEETEKFKNLSSFTPPAQNATKTVNGDKDWKVEYVNNEVQNFGLDDLLLKASELNAENFTKALGQKLDSTKSNFEESSDIVFSIPKGKRNSVDEEPKREIDGEFAKSSKSLLIKSDKVSENEQPVEVPKPPVEPLPKRPGIKVKTVENINEEFKDSLELKNKMLKDCTSSDKEKKVSLLESRNTFDCTSINIDKKVSLLENRNTFGSVPENKTQEQILKKDETVPFTMTIVQGKSQKQRPAILRNSSFKKKPEKKTENLPAAPKEKNIPSEPPPLISMVEETVVVDPPPLEPLPLNIESLNGFSFNSDSLNENTSNAKGFACSKVPKESESETLKTQNVSSNNSVGFEKQSIPFILNPKRKAPQSELPSVASQPINTTPVSNPQVSLPHKLVKVNDGCENTPVALQSSVDKLLNITSVEQKLNRNEPIGRFIKVVPYEPAKKVEPAKVPETSQKVSDKVVAIIPQSDVEGNVLSLTGFASILKDILPERWFTCVDKKYGLLIIKTHVDEFFNPSILISVVVASCGELTVNVRGKQLKKTHELFSNLGDMTISENNLSLNYVLAVIEKLRHLSVCYGCDDLSLKDYWCGNGYVEYHTEFQQVFRSHLCHLLVSLGKKRCYPCYRMNESFRKRYRRDKLEEKAKKDLAEKERTEVEETDYSPRKSVKRNLEDFLEESFSTMKKQISDEIARNKKLDEREDALKAQEEVLSFMGLTRKDNLDNSVRKSKRKKNSFFKLQQPVKKKRDQQELEFLEKYWTDINTLFSTSLLFGAYSRTGRGRLREKCRMFHKLLSTWKNIVRSNPDWIGGEICLPGELTDGESPEKDSDSVDQFEKMDISALRSYIINSVREVNRIKNKLRTRNSYFKILYNKFVKRRMKRPKAMTSPSNNKGNGSSANSTTNTPTPTDLSSDESSRDKGKTTDEEIRPTNDQTVICVSDEGEPNSQKAADATEKCSE